MEEYSGFLNFIVFLIYLYFLYKGIKDYMALDQEIATIIRCHNSIEYLRTIRVDGYIDYDKKLDQKFKELQFDLNSKLKIARDKRKKIFI